LYNYKFCWKILVCCTKFVKDEGTNLFVMATVLHSIIDWEPLLIFRVYGATWFGHMPSKVYQYATNDGEKKLCWKMSMWKKLKIIEAIASALNLVVLTHCVMNQSRGH
jgi:hypothetical protein